jgi:hypothetical protein
VRSACGLGFLGVAGLLWLGLDTPLAQAVEYRLQIVSMWESGFTGFVKPGELGDGASGPGLDHLAGSLDRGNAPEGPLLSDRTVRWASERVARAYGAVHVLPEVKPGGEGTAQWDNVRWDGKTGERSVLVVAPSGRGRPQELYHVVLKGTGPLRHFIPYALSSNRRKLATVRYPLEFLWFHEEGADLWDKFLSQAMDLGNGIGVVVGSSPNSTFPDQVYVVVSQAEQPTTYKVILVWREPPSSLEGPASPGPMR